MVRVDNDNDNVKLFCIYSNLLKTVKIGVISLELHPSLN